MEDDVDGRCTRSGRLDDAPDAILEVEEAAPAYYKSCVLYVCIIGATPKCFNIDYATVVFMLLLSY